MKYISVDIETTGLNKDNCQIIEVGAVFDDLANQRPLDDLPQFHAYITPYRNLMYGEPFAFSMHSQILRRIATQEEGFTYLEECDLPEKFGGWVEGLVEDGFMHTTKFTAAGKNFSGFDRQWLEEIEGWTDFVNIHHRSLDVGSMFVNLIGDDHIPSLDECLKRAGLDKEVAHTAVEDAFDVVRLLRSRVA